MTLETLNELIEYFENQYCLCLDEGDNAEAESFKAELEMLYKQRERMCLK